MRRYWKLDYIYDTVLALVAVCLLVAGCGEKRVDHTTTVTRTVKQPGVTAPAPPPKVIHVPPPDGNLSVITCNGIALKTHWDDVILKYGWPADTSLLEDIKWVDGSPDELVYPLRDTDNKRHCILHIDQSHDDDGSKGKDFGKVVSKELELK